MNKHSNTTFRRIALPVFLLASAATAEAGPRTSTNYTVATDTTDAGGKRATSDAYTIDASVGGITGISTAAAPPETAKHGYAGQLYDVTGLTLTAATTNVNEGATRQLAAWQVLDDPSLLALPVATTNVNEGATRQLAAWQVLDDLSLLALPVTDVTWSVPAGPLTINAGGLATAGAVYQHTAATARGVSAGITATLGLTVVNTLPDNFGLYAADGLEDAWQVQHFGQNNSGAAPGVDADQDGFSNKFEHDAGLIPTDPASVFHCRIEPMPGQPGQTHLIFSPRLEGRTYTVKTSPSLLTTSWITLSGTTFTDNGTERTVTDPDTSGQRKFYRVEILKP